MDRTGNILIVVTNVDQYDRVGLNPYERADHAEKLSRRTRPQPADELPRQRVRSRALA